MACGPHQQEALRAHLVAAPLRLVMVQLLADRANPAHAGSVAVFLGPDHVGDLPREDLGPDSQALYDALARLARLGVPATCWARLEGGSSDAPSLSMSLFTGFRSSPDEAFGFPMTVPPGEPVQVAGTEAHAAVLDGILGRLSGLQTSVELAIAGPLLTVAINGIVVGALSARDSEPRLEIVRRLLDAGLPAHAMAAIRRSSRGPGGFVVSVSAVVVPGSADNSVPQWKLRVTNPD